MSWGSGANRSGAELLAYGCLSYVLGTFGMGTAGAKVGTGRRFVFGDILDTHGRFGT
jgi:hypothetical protein